MITNGKGNIFFGIRDFFCKGHRTSVTVPVRIILSSGMPIFA